MEGWGMSEAAALILDGLAGLDLEDEGGDFPSPEVRLALGSIFGETQTSSSTCAGIVDYYQLTN